MLQRAFLFLIPLLLPFCAPAPNSAGEKFLIFLRRISPDREPDQPATGGMIAKFKRTRFVRERLDYSDALRCSSQDTF